MGKAHLSGHNPGMTYIDLTSDMAPNRDLSANSASLASSQPKSSFERAAEKENTYLSSVDYERLKTAYPNSFSMLFE